MSMTILNVAYPLAEVSAGAVGGAEQVLYQIDRALVQQNHRSLLIASESSAICGTLLPLSRPLTSLTLDTQRAMRQRCRDLLERMLLEHPVDLVHMHGVDCLSYLPPPHVPTLITLHLPPSFYPPVMFHLNRPHTRIHCVSWSQHSACPPCEAMLPPICNGVSVPDHRGVRKRDYTVALGRICPEKGFEYALDAAREAAAPLLLAGRVYDYPEHVRYFQTRILPRLDERRRFIGAVKGRAKARLIAGAQCLLVTSTVPETSSLVAMEALSCGTPVVGLRPGALVELIEDGRTGFLVDDPAQLPRAIADCKGLCAEDCRAAARARCSLETMTRQYLGRYEQIVRTLACSGAGQGNS